MVSISQAERRQITIAFVDLADSTALSVRLDPEDLRAVIGAYQDCVARYVAQHDGFLARLLGDGILIYFGYPNAQENDAERAIRCALDVSAAVRELPIGAELGISLDVRIGIATGSVVAGDVIGTGPALQVTAVGATPNLAARLQSVAKLGMTVISDTTRRLVGGLFAYTDLGLFEAKGFPAPVRAWAVLHEENFANRFTALRSRQMPLIGRDEELNVLLDRWREAVNGNGRAVLVVGEPGIGKSRLISALRSGIGDGGGHFIELMCVPHGVDTALYPVARELLRTSDVKPDDPPALKRQTLRDRMLPHLPSGFDEDAFENVVSICNISVERDAIRPVSLQPPMQQKAKALGLLRDYVLGFARCALPVVIVEDLHWADPTTQEFLDLLVGSIRQTGILVLVTTRPDRLPGWANQDGFDTITLNRLDGSHAAELVRRHAQDIPMSEDLIGRIIERGDGIPLFIEELTVSVVEEKGQAPDQAWAARAGLDAVPESLQASLMARLDRLGEAREIAQIGSVIGRSFQLELLQATSGTDPDRLALLMGNLVQSGIVTAQESGAEREYSFKHSLIQETAYASLTRERQRAIHGRLANVLDARFGKGGIEPQILAWHFGKAGEPATSIEYYVRAAEQPTGRFALAERAKHWGNALAQVARLPRSTDRTRQEIRLRTSLARVLIDLHSSGSDEVRSALEPAVELCRQLGDPSQFVIVFDALALNHHYARANADQMNDYAEELFQIAQTTQDFAAGVWAMRIRCSAHFLRGRFDEARTDMLSVLASYSTWGDSAHYRLMARDPRVSTNTNLGICLTAMGQMKAGMAACMDGIRYAEALPSRASAIAAYRRACMQGIIRGCRTEVMTHADRLADLTTELETFVGTREGFIAHAWANSGSSFPVRHGCNELPDRLRSTIQELEAARHNVHLPFFMAVAADRIAEFGDRDRALALLDRAQSLAEQTNEVWYLAEIWRLKSALLDEHDSERARLLSDSIALARRQGARLWDLRASMTLAGLMAKDHRYGEARDVLEPAVTGWPVDDDDYIEYQQAVALLSLMRQRAERSWA